MPLNVPSHINDQKSFIRTADYYSHAFTEWFLSYNLMLKVAPPWFNVAAISFYFVDAAAFYAAQRRYFQSRADAADRTDPDELMMLAADEKIEMPNVRARLFRDLSELGYNALLFGLVSTSGVGFGLLVAGYFAAYIAKRNMVVDENHTFIQSLLEPALATMTFAMRYLAGPTKGVLFTSFAIYSVIKWRCLSTGYNVMTREATYDEILDELHTQQKQGQPSAPPL